MKKKVLIVNKFYYRRGGDCIYTLNLEELLRRQGHEVAVFAMSYPENVESSWSVYWPKEVNFSGGVGAKVAAVKRTLGMGDVKSAFARLLKDFAPDVVHLNNIHSYLSPVVAQMARKAGAKVVWTLHDNKLLCPSYSCSRDGKPCVICFNNKLNVVKTRCMKGSLAASAIAWIEAEKWNRKRLEAATDVFICPSQFMADNMKKGHFSADKLITLNNFVAPEMIDRYQSIDPTKSSSDYYCYVGRLSHEKGVETLLKAACQKSFSLKVAGDGPLAEQLRSEYEKFGNIEFLGQVSPQQVSDLLANARFSVIPSECYENNPLGVIESLCAGTPVVGAKIGGIPELITDGRGLTFESGNVESLDAALDRAWYSEFDRTEIQKQALKNFSPQTYYSRLIETIY